MSRRLHINGWWVAGGLGGLLVAAGLTASLVFRPAENADLTEDAAVPPTPSSAGPLEEPDEHHDEIMLPDDYRVCTDVLDEAEYASLQNRLFDLVELTENLGRSATREQLIPYVTNFYLQAYSDAPPVLRGAEDIVVTLDREATLVNCEVSARGIITTRVTPVITTSRINEPFKIDLRSIEWVAFDDLWYANRKY